MTFYLAKDALHANASALIVSGGSAIDVSKIVGDATQLRAIKAVGSAGATLLLTVTVSHNFGGTVGANTTSITIQVIIKVTLVKPTVTANDIDLYVIDKLDLVVGLKVVDPSGAGIVIDTIVGTGNTVITQIIPVKGNEATKVINVRVNGLPILEAKGLAFKVGDVV